MSDGSETVWKQDKISQQISNHSSYRYQQILQCKIKTGFM